MFGGRYRICFSLLWQWEIRLCPIIVVLIIGTRGLRFLSPVARSHQAVQLVGRFKSDLRDATFNAINGTRLVYISPSIPLVMLPELLSFKGRAVAPNIHLKQ